MFTIIAIASTAVRAIKRQGVILQEREQALAAAEKEFHLTQVEFKIVALLAKNSGKVMTYDAIMSEIWGPFTDTNNRILRVNMANIRRKMEENPGEPVYILTEIGIGYRMLEDNTSR